MPSSDHPSPHHHSCHNHTHNHHGHYHAHVPTSFGKALVLGISANAAYLIVESLWGVFSHSLSLLADAGHNLFDVITLGAAWLANYLSHKKPSALFTYGLCRFSILVAFVNALVLVIVAGGIVWVAIPRLLNPITPLPTESSMMIVAALGIIVNGISAMLFSFGQKDDLNIRGVFLHMLFDALSSFSVVIAGGLILLTGFHWIDPALSLIIAGAIGFGSWSLLKESFHMTLDAVPQKINAHGLKTYLREIPGIIDFHALHIWPISTTETALTVHLVRPSVPLTPQEETKLLGDVVSTLHQRFGIDHSTVQIETQDYAPFCHLTHSHTV
ncbi:MAG: cation transporter [Acetobacter sp.]|nr:cation transporter [Acetobacter sp.]